MIAAAYVGMVVTRLSARDIDLDQPVEGSTQALVVEHAPVRPMRIAIIGVALALTIGIVAAIALLPWWASLAIVATAGGAGAPLASRDAIQVLERLIPAQRG